MPLEKSLESLSIGSTPPPLPTATPPPPVISPPPPVPVTKEIDESLIKEQLLSSSRLNNIDLLNTIISDVGNREKLAAIINSTKDFIGNTPLHLCCKYGSYEVLDVLLDQEGVEVDPLNKELETPLFLLVQYSRDEPEHGEFIVETLIDAGCDVTLRNTEGLKPVNLVPNQNKELISVLENAEYSVNIDDIDVPEYQEDIVEDLEGDEGESGTESESD